MDKIICYHYINGKKESIDYKFILSLIKEILTCHKNTFLYKNEYEVYLDETTGYKHFYKNDVENFEQFFYQNGKEAILYDGEKHKNINDTKKFIYKSIVFCLTYTLFITLIQIVKSSQITHDSNLDTAISSIEMVEPQITIDRQFFQEHLNKSASLSEENKQLLTNDALFGDLSNTKMVNDREHELEEKMTDIEVIVDTENKPYGNPNGWYRPLTPNILYTIDAENDETIIHEFIHLLQSNNEYLYIREACATIISNEYYGTNSNSYSEEVKRIQSLMCLINPETIWNLNFSGSTLEFENQIYNLLPEEEAHNLLELFQISPIRLSDEDIQQVNNEIDKYICQIAIKTAQEGNDVLECLNSNSENIEFLNTVNMYNYFNKNESDSDFDMVLPIRFSIPIETALQKNIVEIKYDVYISHYVTPSQVSEVESQGIQIKHQLDILNENIIAENGNNGIIFTDKETKQTYTMSEAENLGYVKIQYYYQEKIYNVDYSDIAKYNNNPDISIQTKPTLLAPYNSQSINVISIDDNYISIDYSYNCKTYDNIKNKIL